MQFPFFIIIFGPTGVGKSAIAHTLSTELGKPCEVINADMGQMYTPLSIGTAKPDYKNEPASQHLFDCIDTPTDWTVAMYRERVLALMQEIWNRGAVPILVGGSGFYLSSLFFPPSTLNVSAENVKPPLIPSDPEAFMPQGLYREEIEQKAPTSADLWQELLAIDPERASAIHPHDRYRIERALALWYHSGIAPSALVPLFEPPARCLWYCITRERDELVARIDNRVEEMFKAGWIGEVENLDSPWREFLKTKRLIGYAEIIAFLEERSDEKNDSEALTALKADISFKTRAYAKRQMTYWRMLQKKFDRYDSAHEHVKLIELNASLDVDWSQLIGKEKAL